MENWKPVVGWPGYEVSDFGRVRSHRKVTRILRTRLRGSNSYPCLALYRGSLKTRKDKAIHILVLEAFIGPRPKLKQCRHLDGDPTNNKLENLIWGSASENGQDRVKHGRQIKGSSHPRAVINEGIVRKIWALRESGIGARRIGRALGISWGIANQILLGNSWTHVSH